MLRRGLGAELVDLEIDRLEHAIQEHLTLALLRREGGHE
jgi:hypothetical protein